MKDNQQNKKFSLPLLAIIFLFVAVPSVLASDFTNIFFDGAENGTPASNNWTTQDSVSYSTARAYNGTHSIELGGGTTIGYLGFASLPYGLYNTSVTTFFYDDLFNTTFAYGYQDLALGNSISEMKFALGVWQVTSPTHNNYTYTFNDVRVPTNVTRTEGWHLVRFFADDNDNFTASIDGKIVFSSSVSALGLSTPNVLLRSNRYQATNTSSYFDDVSIDYLMTVCVADWVCDGYGTPVCLVNDTSTAACNSANDNNACGYNYTGDYTEFTNQTGSCDYCSPDWSCDGYDACVNDTQTCNSVNDSNACYSQTGLPSDDYTGDYSEFTTACDACVPDFVCGAFAGCNTSDVNDCSQVNDTNNCYALTGLPSDDYTGDGSEFDVACDYCLPDWSCSSYGVCNESNKIPCDAVNDSNACYSQTGLPSDDYTGDYSEHADTCDYSGDAVSGATTFLFNSLIVMFFALFGLSMFSREISNTKFGAYLPQAKGAIIGVMMVIIAVTLLAIAII